MSFLNSHFLQVAGGVDLHFRDSETGGPPLLMLHSLSDNTHAFDAIIRAGLKESFRLLVPDLRGRGLSGRPETGYSLDDHCTDILALLDSLGIGQVYIAGHSFGALLGLYFAAHYGERVSGLVMIDAADELHTLTPLFLILMTDRLGRWYPSVDAYLLSIRNSPFIIHWDEDMRTAFLADTERLPDGSLYVRTQKHQIAQVAADVYRQRKQDWRNYAAGFEGPALVISATIPFLMGHRILPERNAIETAVLFPKGSHAKAEGNHITMLFGAGAREIARLIEERFVLSAAPVIPAG